VWQKFDDHCHRGRIRPPERGCMNAKPPTTDQVKDQPKESTYALLIHSKEKKRDLLEVAIYPLLILGPLIAIWQFAQQPVNIPPAGLDGRGCIACVDELQTLRHVRHPEIKG
jgi:hypothetical protein